MIEEMVDRIIPVISNLEFGIGDYESSWLKFSKRWYSKKFHPNSNDSTV